MSLINFLGSAGTAFVGGAAQQINVNIAAKKKAEAGIAAEEAKVAAEQKAREAQFELDQEAARLEQERIEKAEEDKRKRLADLAIREYDALSKLETEKTPYIGYDENGYSAVKFVDTVLTQEQAEAFAAAANPNLQEQGYVQIPVAREDGRGFRLDVKEFKEATGTQTFKTTAEAQDYAQKQLDFYEQTGFRAIPLFKPAPGGIQVEFQQAEKAGQESQLFPLTDLEGAQEFADQQLKWYDTKPEFRGKFEAVFETTDDGIAVKFQRTDGKEVTGEVAKSAAGVDLDVHYLKRVSPKAGPDLEKGAYRDFGIASLTGDPINVTSTEQEAYVENETHFVYRKNGVGSNKFQIVESHAGFIQEDFTPEVIRTIERNMQNMGTTSAMAAHRSMVTTFRTFLNNFKDANTVVIPGDNGAILERDLAEQHPWILELAKESPALTKLLRDTPVDPHVPGDATASLNPRNMPVQTVPEGSRRPLLPNVQNSPFVRDQVDPGDGTIVPMLDQAVVNQVYRLESKSGTDAAELLKIVHNARNDVGDTTSEIIKEAYDNIGKLEKTLEKAQFTNEGGFQDPGLGTGTKMQIVQLLEPFSSYNDKYLALSTALPPLTIRRAGFNAQLSRNTSRQGKYESVTGGAMEFKVVGEQLQNADNMASSISGLRGAIKEGGEVGFVLEAESLVTGGKYLFDTVISNLEFEEGTDGSKIINGVRTAFEDAQSETDPQKRANALVRVYATMLSYQLARLMDPNGRLSDEDRRTVESAIGLKGIKATPDKLLLVAEQLEEQVEYLQARNRAYQSGNTRMIMAAFTYDNMTGGGNIANVLPRIMSTITDGTTTGGTTGGSGATISPAIQRAIDMQNRASSTSGSVQTVPATGNPQQVPPAQRPTIPTL